MQLRNSSTPKLILLQVPANDPKISSEAFYFGGGGIVPADRSVSFLTCLSLDPLRRRSLF